MFVTIVHVSKTGFERNVETHSHISTTFNRHIGLGRDSHTHTSRKGSALGTVGYVTCLIMICFCKDDFVKCQ